MSNITLERKFRTNIYQVATADPVLGGPVSLDINGDPDLGTAIANVHGKQIGDRTEWLKWRHGSSSPSKRNSIQSGKLDGSGLPAFVDASTPEVLASALVPLVLNFSGGFDEFGPIDYYKFIDADTPIVPEIGTGTEKLFAIYDDVTDTVSFLSTTGAYQYGPTIPPAVGNLYWFDPKTYTFWESDGVSVWSQIYGMLLGSIDYVGPSFELIFPGVDQTGNTAPVGSIHAYGGEKEPLGYFLCKGQAVSRVVYAELFDKLGESFGAGNGTTTFNIPDLRGQFLRGFADGTGIDGSRVFGSQQAADIGGHNHNAAGAGDFITYDPTYTAYDLNSIAGGNGGRVDSNTGSTGTNIGSETRPDNVAVSYIIKF